MPVCGKGDAEGRTRRQQLGTSVHSRARTELCELSFSVQGTSLLLLCVSRNVVVHTRPLPLGLGVCYFIWFYVFLAIKLLSAPLNSVWKSEEEKLHIPASSTASEGHPQVRLREVHSGASAGKARVVESISPRELGVREESAGSFLRPSGFLRGILR